MKRFLRIAVVLALMASMVFAVVACNNNKGDIKPEDIASIAITTMPTKTAYKLNEKADYTGGKFTVNKVDGTSEVLDFTAKGVEIKGFDSKSVGTKTLTLTYGGKSDTFTIYVTNGEIGTISFSEQPRTIFVVGQDFDKKGGKLSVTENGATKDVSFEDPDVYVTGYDKNKLGAQTLTVSYHGATTSLVVNVYNPIEVEGVQQTYYTNEPFNYTTGKVWYTGNDGEHTEYALNASEVKLTFGGANEFNSSTAGTVEVTVTCKGATGKFTVTITAGKLKEIKAPDKTDYTTDDKKIDLTGGAMILTDANGGNERSIPLTDATVTGFEEALASAKIENRGDNKLTKVITVEYGNYKGSFNITVSFGDVKFMQYQVAELGKIYDKNSDTWNYGQTQTDIQKWIDIIIECAQIVVDNENAADELSEDDLRVIIANAVMLLPMEWSAEIEPFNGLYGYSEEQQSYGITCANYQSAKTSYNEFSDYINNGSKAENKYHDLYVCEYLINSIIELYPDVIALDYGAYAGGSAYAGNPQYMITVADFFEQMSMYTSMQDLWESEFKGYDKAFELYELFNGKNITMDNYSEHEDDLDDAFDSLMEGIDAATNGDETYVNRNIYGIAAMWYGANGNNWNDSKSMFDIIYAYEFDRIESMDQSNQQNAMIDMAYLATYLQLPHLFEQYYGYCSMMQQYAAYINYYGVTSYYIVNYNSMLEEGLMDEFYEALANSDFYQECVNNINLIVSTQQGTTVIPFLGFIYNYLDAPYYQLVGSSYGDEDFEKFVNDYNNFDYDVSYEAYLLQNYGYEQLTQAGYKVKYYTQNGQFSDTYTKELTDLVERFFELDDHQVYNFSNSILPFALEELYPTLAPHYYEGGDLGDAGWYAESTFAAMLETYLGDKLNDDDYNSDEFRVAAQIFEAYEYLLKFLYSGLDAGVSVEADSFYGIALVNTFNSLNAKYASVKNDIIKVIPECEEIYETLKEAVEELQKDDDERLNYEIEDDDAQALWDAYHDALTNLVMTASYCANSYPAYVQMFAAYDQVLALIEDMEAEFDENEGLRKAFYYGLNDSMFIDQNNDPLTVGEQYVLEYALMQYMQTYQTTIVGYGFYEWVASEELTGFVDTSKELCAAVFNLMNTVDDDETDDNEFEKALETFNTEFTSEEIMEVIDEFLDLNMDTKMDYFNLDGFSCILNALIYSYADELGYKISEDMQELGDNVMGAFVDIIIAKLNLEYMTELMGDDLEEDVIKSYLETYQDAYDEAIESFERYFQIMKSNPDDYEVEADEAIKTFKEKFDNLIKEYMPKDYDFDKILKDEGEEGSGDGEDGGEHGDVSLVALA